MPSHDSIGPVKKQVLPLVSLTILFLFALGLRIHHLDFESLWMDELRQVSYYPHTFVNIIYKAATQQQPPLDYWIGHLVVIFSNSDFAVRLPAALFGTGSVILITILVGRVCGWSIALGTGLIAALLPFNLRFSQEARPYAIAIFFLLAVLWSLDRLLSTKNRRFAQVLLPLFQDPCATGRVDCLTFCSGAAVLHPGPASRRKVGGRPGSDHPCRYRFRRSHPPVSPRFIFDSLRGE